MSAGSRNGRLSPDENLRKWHVSRRRFMTLAGLGAVATGVGAVLPGLIDGDEDAIPVRGTHGEPESIGQAGGGESARRIRQWMMIIDLRRCDGCQSQGTPPQCTEACNDGHFIPEPMEWIEVYEHELSDEAKFSLEGREPDLPIDGTRFIPTPCQQCQNAPCVNVCPVGATWSTPEGVVLIDQERCIGCRMCMAACPYERRFFTWSDPPIHPDSIFVEPSPEHQVPLKKGVVAKCDFCPEMARAGRLPFCAQACPQNAIYYGDLEEDLATNGVEVVRASAFMAEHSATHYKEELGTRPRVFYIPGHGELAGRDATDRGRLPVRWLTPDEEGAKTWQRSKG